jgi:beta-glucanase (GH16 family)
LCPNEPCGVRDGTITSARITTLDKFEFRYGKVVARIKMPVGQGTWPAFWALGANFPEVGWPRTGEIDFVEVYNNTYNSAAESEVAEKTTTSAMHWCDELRVPDPNEECFPAGRIFETDGLEWPVPLDEDFHIWESDWTADKVTFSIDGVQYFELEIDPVLMEEFRRDFFLLLNVAMGGTLGSGGQPPQGDETFPQTMLVDYVRVYQRTDDISPPELNLVTISSSNANPGFATIGDIVTVSLTADEPIAAPTVTIGDSPATTVSGSGTAWQASRALTAEDAQGVIPFTVEFTDLAGNDGFPVSASTDQSRVTADSVSPGLTTVTIVSDNANQGLAIPGDTVTVTLNADEAIAQPVVTIGGTDVVPTGSGANWQASRQVGAGDPEGVVTFSIGYADIAGNSGPTVTETTDSTSVLVNISAPTVTITGAPETFATLAPIPVSFEFSKLVTGFELDDVAVTNGGASGFVAIDGETYSAVVTPTGLGNLVIGVPAGAASDAGGVENVAAGDVVVASALNADAPLLTTVSISSSNADPAFAAASDVITLAITASESISTPTVTIAGAPANVTGSGSSYEATRAVLVSDPEGAVEFSIGNFQASDDGTPGFESTVTTDGSSVTLDVTAPTLAISGLPADVEFLEPVPVTFRFDEAVNGFDVTDIGVTNGSVGAFTIVDESTYAADITPDGVGDLTVAVAAAAATDAAGNASAGASETSVVDSAWRLVASDNFEGGLNPLRWTARTDADCPDPCDGVQTYLTERVTVANGRATIEARNEGGFSSGLIDTRGKVEFRFGRVEIDAKMPGTQGTLPSLRLLPAIPPGETLPNYGPWPQSGEIDIVNAPNLGPGNSTLEHSLRYGLPQPEDTVTTATSSAPGVPTLDDIQYAIEWEGGEIRWFVNDVHVATQTQDNWYAYFEDADDDGRYDPDGAFTLGAGAAPFDRDFYLAIGLAVGSNADSFFPQTLEIDAVRVYECANPLNPAAGTGCSTGTGVPPVSAPDAPSTDSLDFYIDGPATLGFVEPEGTTSFATLSPFAFLEDPGVVVTSVIDAPDGANTFWAVGVQSTTGSFGSVIMAAQSGNPADSSRYFDLSGGGTAGEILFRMRVNSASAGARLEVGLVDRPANVGSVDVDFVADEQWRDYSVKISDVSVDDGAPVDLADIFGVFFGGADGNVNFDLDDIRIKVACRDGGGCEATPRADSSVPPTVVYSEDFEALEAGNASALGTFGGAGFQIFADVWDGPWVPVLSSTVTARSRRPIPVPALDFRS